MTFQEILKLLSQPIEKPLIKQREGWTRRDGGKVMVDYISWSTAADLLDRYATEWEFDIEEAYYFEAGNYWVCRAVITVCGVKRRGIGTGIGADEKAIKKAEHDALKRAAVKFGIGRELYRDDDDDHSHDHVQHVQSASYPAQSKPIPSNPLAKSVSELATPKQIVMIRALCRDLDIDCDTEVKEVMKLDCKVEELSRRAASAFIDHLKAIEAERGDNVPIVRRSH